MAGGITSCPDWQTELIDKIGNYSDLTIFNPRRKEFSIADSDISEEQIKWEFERLKESTVISVWFSSGSLNPIVLYELGTWVNARPEIPAFIGIDEEYTRKQDVRIQTRLARPEIEIVNSLGSLAMQVKDYLSSQAL